MAKVCKNGPWSISDTDHDLKNQEMTGALTNDSVDVVEINDSTPLFEDIRPENWKEIYAGILENWLYGTASYMNLGLIYLNDDDIPELVAEIGGESNIFMIQNGKILDFNTERYGFCFKERGNLLLNQGGGIGYFYSFYVDEGEGYNGYNGFYRSRLRYHSDGTYEYVEDEEEAVIDIGLG